MVTRMLQHEQISERKSFLRDPYINVDALYVVDSIQLVPVWFAKRIEAARSSQSQNALLIKIRTTVSIPNLQINEIV